MTWNRRIMAPPLRLAQARDIFEQPRPLGRTSRRYKVRFQPPTPATAFCGTASTTLVWWWWWWRDYLCPTNHRQQIRRWQFFSLGARGVESKKQNKVRMSPPVSCLFHKHTRTTLLQRPRFLPPEDRCIAALLALGLDRDEALERSWQVKIGQCSVCLVGGGDDDASVLECEYCQRLVCLSCTKCCETCFELYCTTCTTTKCVPSILWLMHRCSR